MNRKVFLPFLCCGIWLLFSFSLRAQSGRDTARIGALVKQFDDSLAAGRMDKCEKYLLEAGRLNKEIKDKHYMLVLLLKSSWFYYRKGEFQTAYDLAEKAQQLAGEQKNDRSLADALNYMGMNIARLGDVARALADYQKALDLYEQTRYTKGRINVLTNIAGIYFDEGDFALAITYFQKALEFARGADDQKMIGSLLNNIGSAYDNMDNEKQARDYYLQAVEQNLVSGNEHALAYNYLNLANIELGEKNIANAEDYNKKAMTIFTRFGDKFSVVGCMCQQADIAMNKNDRKRAIDIYTTAIRMSESTHSPLLIERTLKAAAGAYEKIGDYKTAAALLNRFIATKDSIINDEIRSEVTKKQMQFEFDKKRMTDSLNRAASENALRQEILLHENESRQNRTLLLIALVVLGLIGLLAFNIYRSNVRNKKASVIIGRQKEIAEQQRAAIEAKNREILDSMSYAKRLQEAILPPDKMVKQVFPDSFVFYRPKDIVAGDFYWMNASGENILFAVADCTGHGVPGAMVSVVCSNALDRAVKEFRLSDPGKILDKVTIFVQETFEKSESDVLDGMDIALCSLKPEGKGYQLSFAGAYNPLWIIRRKELIAFDGNKQPVGKSYRQEPFTTHHFSLQSGDLLFMFTDGFADQFGGPRGKKFKYRPLLNRLIAISGETMDYQHKTLENIFDEWKGELEQIDDVCVIGIRI